MLRQIQIAEYPADFDSLDGEDVSLNLNLLQGGKLLHEPNDLCWCEPETTHYDEDLEGWVYVHRYTQS